VEELSAKGRVLKLTAQDFSLVNPNTGAAPIFRNARDAAIVTAIYGRHPVLVNRAEGGERKAWPVRYVTMFHMTNDSGLFLRGEELVEQGWEPAPLNRWRHGESEAVPLYEGKMVQMFDHRAADVVVNAGNLHRPAQQQDVPSIEKAISTRFPKPQFWVDGLGRSSWALAFKLIAAPTNSRTMIAAVLPNTAAGNSLGLLLPEQVAEERAINCCRLAANLSALALDFVLRQKLQGQNLNWFIVEQLPFVAAAAFEAPMGDGTITDYVCGEVLRLTYTAHDMAGFAADLGDVDAQGRVLPPFVWDEADRRARMALLDALFMHLYGISRDDAAYILNSFPIVREKDEAAHGEYVTKRLILEAMDEIAAGGLARLAALSPAPRRHGD
jgi:hypothetical protein